MPRYSAGSSTFLQEPQPFAQSKNLIPQSKPRKFSPGSESSSQMLSFNSLGGDFVEKEGDYSSGLLGGAAPVTTTQVD